MDEMKIESQLSEIFGKEYGRIPKENLPRFWFVNRKPPMKYEVGTPVSTIDKWSQVCQFSPYSVYQIRMLQSLLKLQGILAATALTPISTPATSDNQNKL